MSDFKNSAIETDTNREVVLINEIDQLKKVNESLQSAIKEKDFEIDRYIRFNEGMQTDIQHQNERNDNQERLVLSDKTQLEDQENCTNNTELKVIIKELEQKSIHLKDSNEEYRLKINELLSLKQKEENEKNELIEIKEKLINMLTEKEIEILELKSTIETYNKKQYDNDKDKDKDKDIKIKISYDKLEQEYEEYKQKKEAQFEVFRNEIEEMRSNEESFRNKLDDLEYDNTCLQEEIQLYEIEKVQYDYQIKSLADVQHNKYVYQNEIEALQVQIRNLIESKEKLKQNSSIEKNNALNERNELEEKYNRTRYQNEALNSQLNKLNKSMITTQREITDGFMKEITMKNKVIDQLQEIFEKKDQKIAQLEKIIEKNEQQLRSVNYTLLELQNKQEEEKRKSDSIVNEINSKAENDVNQLQLKIKELMHKLEECNMKETFDNNNKEKSHEINKNITLNYALAEDHKSNEDIIAKNTLIDNLIQEKKYYEALVNELMQSTSKANVERLTAEKNYLEKTVDSLKKQIAAIKAQKEKDSKYYESELKSYIDESIKLKLEYATLALENDREILKKKKIIQVLKNKLGTLGVSMNRKANSLI